MFTPSSVKQSGNPDSPSVEYPVGTRNRWSRLQIAFDGLPPGHWLELSAALRADPDEEAVDVADFAALGIEFRTEDGSSIDVPRVPGLGRTTIDAHGAWLAGPSGSAGRAFRDLRLCFYLPAPASRVVVSIRSWRNTRTFHVGVPVLREALGGPPSSDAGDGEAGRATAPPYRPTALGKDPVWFRYGLVPSRPITLRGQLVRSGTADGGVVHVVFRDAAGALIAPPYPGIMATASLPAFVNIPIHRDAYRFAVEIAPPPGAVTLDAGFAAWSEPSTVALISAPEVLLGGDLRLEALAEEAGGSAGSVVAGLLARLGRDAASPGADLRLDLAPAGLAEPHAPLQACAVARSGSEAARWTAEGLRLDRWPAWPLPESPDWRADPFSAPAWRLAFQSLSWLRGAVGEGDRSARGRAVALCLSWSRANSWGQPADPLSLHPTCLARRAETLLGVLSAALRDAAEEDAPTLDALGCEVVQHGLALAEILGQNTLTGTLLEIQAAASLLGIGRALSTFPMAAHWTSLAISGLRRSFDEQLGLHGALASGSYHGRLELVALGLALLPVLRSPGQPTGTLAEHLESHLVPAWRGLARLLEPDGTLPLFCAAPAHVDGRAWIARLAASQETCWIADAAGHVGAAADGTADGARGALALRRTGREGWASFTSDFAAQHDPLDHRDCTAFTFATGAMGWITDAGGSHPQQTRRLGRHLAAGSAHNVVLPDGREQMAGSGFLRPAVRIGAATVHVIDTTVHGPDYRHARAFVLLDDLSGIAVFDTFTAAGRPLFLEGFLHFARAVTVALIDPQRAYGLRDGRRLSIVARMLAGRSGGTSLTSGWNGSPPEVRGSGAGPDEAMQPAAVLRYGMTGRETVCGGLLITPRPESLAELTRITESDPFAALVFP